MDSVLDRDTQTFLLQQTSDHFFARSLLSFVELTSKIKGIVIQPIMTCVLSWSLCRWKSFPSGLSWEAPLNMVRNVMLKSVGAKTQPCLMPLVNWKVLECSRSSCTLSCMPLCNCQTIMINFSRRLNSNMILQRPSWLTVILWFVIQCLPSC